MNETESIELVDANEIVSKVAAPTGRLESIDFLRGCAAMGVVVLHVALSGGIPNAPLWFRIVYDTMLKGRWGVPLFFVISGFCIHLRWAKQQATIGVDRLNFVEFWKRRIHRLYPPYFIVLCLSMLMVYGAYKMGRELPLVAKYPSPQPRWMIYDFLLHVTMLHGFSPSFDTAGGNNVLWSLAREEYFYLMYFILMIWRRRWNVLVSTAIVLVLGVVTNVSFAHNPHWTQFVARSAIVLWFQWCLGMVAVEAYYGLIKLPRWCASGYMVVVWFILADLSTFYFVVAAPFLGGMAFFVLLNFCVKQESMNRWSRNAVVAWLGRVGIFSYSLYLVHNPIRAVLKQLLHRYSYTQNPVQFLAIGAVLGLGGYWGGRLFFWVVERRFLNSSRSAAYSRVR
jgi:peptidoglycan/LPS O-acetylase OafA/YrhL